jgi:hypothetical protein
MKIKTLSIKEVELDFSIDIRVIKGKRYIDLKYKKHSFSTNTWNAQNLIFELLRLKGIKIE